MSRIKSYFTKWKLVLKTCTQVMFFTKRRTRQLPHRPFQIRSGGTITEIGWSQDLKYLGVIFNKTLTYRDHIQHVLKRTATKILYSLINHASTSTINYSFTNWRWDQSSLMHFQPSQQLHVPTWVNYKYARISSSKWQWMSLGLPELQHYTLTPKQKLSMTSKTSYKWDSMID